MQKTKFNWLIFITIILCVAIDLNYKNWTKTERVIGSDIHHYYGYLPALFIYDDLKLEKSDYKYGEDLYYFWSLKTPEGKNVIKMTSGLAICYAPFFFIGDVIALMTKYEANGFSEPYKVMLLISTIFYLIIGIIYTRKLLEHFSFESKEIIITLILVVFGTNLFAYSTIEAPMLHAYSFCLIAMFVYYFLKWFDQSTNTLSLAIGLLFGLIVLIRPSDIVFSIVPLLYAGNQIFSRQKLIKLITIALPTALLVWVPQLCYWKYVTGHFFYWSYKNEGFNFSDPHIIDGLFSFRKGWLIYTPVMIFAIAGIFFLYPVHKKFILPLLFFLIVNCYVVFSWWCWWYGGSLGMRPMIDFYAILAIPLAAFVSKLRKGNLVLKISGIAIFSFLVWLNLFQVFQYKNSSLHYDAMTKELYFRQFGKIDQIDEFDKYLDPPDYAKASEIDK